MDVKDPPRVTPDSDTLPCVPDITPDLTGMKQSSAELLANTRESMKDAFTRDRLPKRMAVLDTAME